MRQQARGWRGCSTTRALLPDSASGCHPRVRLCVVCQGTTPGCASLPFTLRQAQGTRVCIKHCAKIVQSGIPAQKPPTLGHHAYPSISVRTCCLTCGQCVPNTPYGLLMRGASHLCLVTLRLRGHICQAHWSALGSPGSPVGQQTPRHRGSHSPGSAHQR